MTDEDLKKEGWTRQTTIDEPRLSELAELYESLGLEVHLEPVVAEEMSEECKQCFKGDPGDYRTIYTRKKNEVF
jgi:hypothetical protein